MSSHLIFCDLFFHFFLSEAKPRSLSGALLLRTKISARTSASFGRRLLQNLSVFDFAVIGIQRSVFSFVVSFDLQIKIVAAFQLLCREACFIPDIGKFFVLTVEGAAAVDDIAVGSACFVPVERNLTFIRAGNRR